MDLLLNEKKYAEYVLENNIVDKKPSATAQLLVRYFWHECGYRKKKILQEINSFMQKSYDGYNADDWYDVICRYITNAKKFPLIKVDCIHISQTEMTQLNKLQNDQTEKLMFTCLCLAKYYNAARSTNSNWVNVKLSQLFKIANLSGNERSKLLRIHTLYDIGYISMSMKCDNTNLRVEIISDGSDYTVAQLNDLGNLYMVFSGRGFYCQSCGKYQRLPQTKIKRKNEPIKKICKQCQLDDTSIKMIVCEDCGVVFEVTKKNNKTTRCPACSEERRKKMVANNVAQYRIRQENVIISKNEKNEENEQ